MRRGRVRMLAAADAVGGVWTYAVELARGLAPHGVETVLAVLGPEPSPAQRRSAEAVPGLGLVATGLPLDWTAERPEEVEQAAAALARLARQAGADLVQLNAAAYAAADFPAPVIAVQHSCVATWWDAVKGGDMPADFAWRCDQVRAGLAAADAVVAPTAAFGEATRLRHRLDAAPHTVHNGRAPLRLAPRAPHDCVFTAGRLWDAGKNVATLDSAAARLSVPVYAAGPLESPVGERATFANIHCLGTLDPDALGGWLACRPVFASAAKYEPFGLSVLEAAQAGCALVLSDIPTFRELWDGAALFVPADDADAFAETLGELVGDDFERSALGRAARERAARFTPQAMAAGMAAICRELLPAERRPALSAARAAA